MFDVMRLDILAKMDNLLSFLFCSFQQAQLSPNMEEYRFCRILQAFELFLKDFYWKDDL